MTPVRNCPRMSSSESGILDVALDGPAQRPRAVGPVAAGRVDDPVDHLGQHLELQLPIGQVLVQVVDEQRA